MLTDISSEMVSSILPIYLVLHLRMSPLAFGAVDGIYQGFAALLRLLSGFAGDYLGRHKTVATVGYALSAFCRIGLLAAGNAWTAIAAIVALDRTGKGIRTAPRDALISAASPPGQLARAFGLHRSLDAAGAMLGPLCAFLILAWLPSRFDLIFVLSFCIALVGVGVIGLFVRDSPDGQARLEPRASLKDAVGLWRHGPFRSLVIAAALLSLATVSDAFIFLSLQQQAEFSAGLFPLLFVGVSLTNFVLATPVGRLADRHGRLRVFVAGHLLLAPLYGILFISYANTALIVMALVLLGGYYAATDGVLAALAASRLPTQLRGSGLAMLATGTNVGRLLSSLSFGVLWNSLGRVSSVGVFAVGLTIALVVAVTKLRLSVFSTRAHGG
jgi:MFS family permease